MLNQHELMSTNQNYKYIKNNLIKYNCTSYNRETSVGMSKTLLRPFKKRRNFLPFSFRRRGQGDGWVYEKGSGDEAGLEEHTSP